MAKTSKEYSKKYGTIQIWVEDKVELEKVHAKSGKARVWLMKEAVELLKKKYRVKDESDFYVASKKFYKQANKDKLDEILRELGYEFKEENNG